MGSDQVITNLGAADVDTRLEEQLIDGVLFAFQEQVRRPRATTDCGALWPCSRADPATRTREGLEADGVGLQTTEDNVILNGFGTIANALGGRCKPYLPQLNGTILWRMNNKSARVRQQAADLVARIAVVIRTCGEEKMLSHWGQVMYEYLGEEYPDVLAAILGALKSIVNVIGMSKMSPPIKDLLPRLTPIMKNRHEKVQENCTGHGRASPSSSARCGHA